MAFCQWHQKIRKANICTFWKALSFLHFCVCRISKPGWSWEICSNLLWKAHSERKMENSPGEERSHFRANNQEPVSLHCSDPQENTKRWCGNDIPKSCPFDLFVLSKRCKCRRNNLSENNCIRAFLRPATGSRVMGQIRHAPEKGVEV